MVLAVELTGLPPLLCAFLVRLLSNVKCRIQPLCARLVAMLLWLVMSVAMGWYPPVVQAWLAAALPWRSAFQNIFLAYQSHAGQDLIWTTNFQLALIASFVTLALSLAAGRATWWLPSEVIGGVLGSAAAIGLFWWALDYSFGPLVIHISDTFWWLLLGLVAVFIVTVVGSVAVRRYPVGREQTDRPRLPQVNFRGKSRRGQA